MYSERKKRTRLKEIWDQGEKKRKALDRRQRPNTQSDLGGGTTIVGTKGGELRTSGATQVVYALVSTLIIAWTFFLILGDLIILRSGIWLYNSSWKLIDYWGGGCLGKCAPTTFLSSFLWLFLLRFLCIIGRWCSKFLFLNTVFLPFNSVHIFLIIGLFVHLVSISLTKRPWCTKEASSTTWSSMGVVEQEEIGGQAIGLE